MDLMRGQRVAVYSGLAYRTRLPQESLNSVCMNHRLRAKPVAQSGKLPQRLHRPRLVIDLHQANQPRIGGQHAVKRFKADDPLPGERDLFRLKAPAAQRLAALCHSRMLTRAIQDLPGGKAPHGAKDGQVISLCTAGGKHNRAIGCLE
ncbi:hypothetical protein SDC9_120379 [bioreactor metagenome]|uniref:Uncharacterized protein n=1 Tax=bioreactor metagenome TaxID=1076179 RepID=A0A645C6X6_9ZZZZ